jgi:arginine N-succinyltransferase
MKIIRPIAEKDLEAFETFAFRSRFGITNLPKNHQLLHQKIRNSIMTFDDTTRDPFQNMYVFVLEDTDTGLVHGTSAIHVKSGGEWPLYSYEIINQHPRGHDPKIFPQRLLKPTIKNEGPSELCALYLLPQSRHGGFGRLLSLGRLLYIADHQDKFSPTILAEMRGAIDEKGLSVFWEGLGRKFYDVPLIEIFDKLTHGRAFISDILPEHSIYISLLSPETQAAIGVTHEHTRPALKMLQEEGLHFSNHVDIFDGGPIIAGTVSELRCVKDSVVSEVEQITKTQFESAQYLISNRKADYRATIGFLSIKGDKVTLQHDVAYALEINVGDKIRYIKLIAEG